MTAAHALGVAAAVAAAVAWVLLVRYGARHPRALDGDCPWCSMPPLLLSRNLAALPSDCRCARPCPAVACGARTVKETR